MFEEIEEPTPSKTIITKQMPGKTPTKEKGRKTKRNAPQNGSSDVNQNESESNSSSEDKDNREREDTAESESVCSSLESTCDEVPPQNNDDEMLEKFIGGRNITEHRDPIDMIKKM